LVESDIIQRYFKPLYQKHHFDFDDSCIITPLKNSQNLVASKDILTQDHHFRLSYGGKNIAKKLLLSNLSDLSASGAKPISYILGCSFSKNCHENFVAQFSQGLQEIQKQYGLHLIGGDTIISDIDKSFFSLTIFGERPVKANNLKLSQAQQNDDIFITGNIGDSFLGFCLLENNFKFQNISEDTKSYLTKRHLEPIINIDFSQILAEKKLINAATDCSDGLIIDLGNISRESKVSYGLFEESIPHSKEAKEFLDKNKHLSSKINNWGEDYELIFTAPQYNREKITNIAKNKGIKISLIGIIK
jgi:thiamine-monophosphate kinase